MPYTDITLAAGTQKSTQQTDITQGAWIDTDHVHFPFEDQRITTLPPYAVAVLESDYVDFLGAVRSIHAKKFTGVNGGTFTLFGSNTRLYAARGNTVYNITPFAGQRSATLGSDPLDTVNADATLTINYTAHGLSVGDHITLAGATDVGGVTADTYINIEHEVATVPDADSITVEMGINAASTASGGGDFITATTVQFTAALDNPLDTTITSAIVTFNYTSHGLAVGDRIRLADLAATGGIPASELNAEHIIATVPDVDSFTFVVTTVATSTVTGGGGLGIHIFTPIASGFINQAAAEGFGAGLYGEGIYGVGGESVSAQQFPRIWSFGNFGNSIVMCAGDYTEGDGQKIYIWDGDLTVAPTPLTNAPENCNWVEVVNNHIVALCGTDVNISEIGSSTVWTGITTYQQQIQRAWKLINCTVFNEKEALIFTPNGALSLRYVGGQDMWDIAEIFRDDGLIAPNASCVINSRLFWRGARASYVYTGAPVERVPNDQNNEWIIDNINLGQAWKCFTAVDTQNSEWYFYFPNGAENEPSDYVIYSLKNGSHTLGMMDRTAAQRPDIIDGTYFMADASSASVAGTIYRHLTNGATTFSWSAASSFAYANGAENRVMIDQFITDSSQSGDFTLNVLTKEYAQSTAVTSADYTITSTIPYKTVKAAGKLLAIKVHGSVQFTLGKWKMNLRKLGRR